MKSIKTRAIELGNDLALALYHMTEIEKIYERSDFYFIPPHHPSVKDLYTFYCLVCIDGRFSMRFSRYVLDHAVIQIDMDCAEHKWEDMHLSLSGNLAMRYYEE